MAVQLSMTTDYAQSSGDPLPYLQRIAEAGFSHIHWCHHWNTDFLYSRSEIGQILEWLERLGLSLLDLHGSAGVEKDWASPLEYRRLAGVELVRNRVAMAGELGADVVIMHVPSCGDLDPVRRSLGELMAFCRGLGVRLALENMADARFSRLLGEYAPDYVGLCYDSGHGNIHGQGLDCLEAVRERLISVHLHDNDGTSDQHLLLFSGTVDWTRLARIMAVSAYGKCVSMEVTMSKSGFTDESVFLARAHDTGSRFSEMLAAAKSRSIA